MRTLLLAAAVLILHAGDAAAYLQPGFHDNVPCSATPEFRFAIHVPPQYAREPERRFPVLFCQHPGGKPSGDVKKKAAWADRFGVVVVGIIGPANGMDQGKKNQMADAVVKSLATDGARLHPFLRFTYGVSGGSADGQRFARRLPKTFAGLCDVAEHRTGSKIANPNLAIGIIHGGKDPVCNPHGVLSEVIARWKTQGNPVRWTLSQLAGHTSGPPGADTEMLTWELWTARLGHPELTDDEKAQHRSEASVWATSILADTDLVQQRRDTQLWLSLPVQDRPETAAIAQRWQALVGSEAAKLPSADQLAAVSDALAGERWEPTTAGKDGKRCWIISASGTGLIALPDAVRTPMQALIDRLAADPATAKDWELHRKVRELVLREIDTGVDKDALAPVTAAYADLAKELPTNRWCQEAADHAQRLGSGVAQAANDGGEKAPGAP